MGLETRPFGFVIGRGPWKVEVQNPLVLAPMAGVCDLPFRLICKEMGCGLVYTEMISAMALIYDDPNTARILAMDQAERPVGAQVFGSDPRVVARAAGIMQDHGADFIDINMGCPVPKIVKNGEGSALMRQPQLAADIVAAVRQQVRIPVTVKIRKGWDDETVNAVEFAVVCVEAGADAVAVHGRTRAQGYSGKADWNIIAEVSKAVDVPVLGNGDVTEPEHSSQLMSSTGCAGVMIGRGALGNPWLFSRALSYLQTGEIEPEPTARQRLHVALDHLERSIAFKGESVACKEMRKHLAWYIKGLRGAARIREAINNTPDCDGLRDVIRAYLGTYSE